MKTEILTSYLDSNGFEYNLDQNPSPEKVNRIRTTLERKRNLMDLAVSTYKQVMRIK